MAQQLLPTKLRGIQQTILLSAVLAEQDQPSDFIDLMSWWQQLVVIAVLDGVIQQSHSQAKEVPQG